MRSLVNALSSKSCQLNGYTLLARCARQFKWLSFSSSKTVSPASPAAVPCTVKLGKTPLIDPYSWLSNYQRAKDYILQEQTHFRCAAKQLAPLQQQLLSELRQHVSAQNNEPSEPVGSYLYRTSFTPEGSQTVTRLKTKGTGQQQHQVVVSDELIHQDLAQLPHLQLEGAELVAVKLSQDQQLVAYGVANSTEQQACIVRDLRTGGVLPDMVLPAVTSFEWSADGAALFYTTADAAGRPNRVYCRRQERPADDVLLFEEADVQHFVTLTRTKDWRYVLINTTSKLSSEVHLLDTHDVSATPVCVQARQPGLQYFVEHHHGHLLLLTNHTFAQQFKQPVSAQGETSQQVQHHLTDNSAADYSLCTLPTAALSAGGSSLQQWRLLRPELPGSAVTDMDVFNGCVVLHTLHDSRPALALLHLDTCSDGRLAVSQQHEVQLPDWALWLRPGINGDYSSTSFRLFASSPAHPEMPLQVDLSTGALGCWQEGTQIDQTLYRHSPAHQQTRQDRQQSQQQHASKPRSIPPIDLGLVSQRLWATAADGTAVPFTLLHKAGHARPTPQPLMVEVYGAYGHVLEAEFKPHRLTLLNRGWSVVLAHVRGGGELGQRWHAAGRQLLKHHSVTDLLAVLQHLMDQHITAPSLITGHAASAGGLTLAAAINAQPEWFSAAVLEAPFVDWVAGTGAVDEAGLPLVGDHLLTQHETDEWGDPWRDPAVAELVCRLCPYTNLRAGVTYPAMMLTAGLQDSRVDWWMPVKFVAKLRSMQAHSMRTGAGNGCSSSAVPVVDNNSRGVGDVLLQFDESGSHFSMGLSGGNLQDAALQQAFMLTRTATPPA